MKAYSEDLRQKIVEATERDVPKAQAARRFDMSLSSVKRYVRWFARRAASLAPGKASGRPPTIDHSAKKLSKKTWEHAQLPLSWRGAAFWSESPARA